MNNAYNRIARIARVTAGIVTALCVTPVFAHPGHDHAAFSLVAGFAHPFSGLDHLLAFSAIGLWAAQYRRSAAWGLPLLFLLVMALGAVAGVAGIALPGVEMGIAASVVVLGLLLAFAFRIPLWASALLVTAFASLHGYAHGMELPQGASAGLYGLGFIVATALLHLAGLALGKGFARKLVPAIGAAIAASGVYLLALIG